MFKAILVITMSIALIGCGSKPIKPQVIVEYKTVYNPLPEHLLKDCEIAKPMSKEEYMSIDPLEREIWLTNYSMKHMKNLSLCNAQMDSIRTLNNEYKALYTDNNTK